MCPDNSCDRILAEGLRVSSTFVTWAPAGGHVLYGVRIGTSNQLALEAIDGSSPPIVFPTQATSTFAPDGRLATAERTGTTVKLLVRTPPYDAAVVVSADGSAGRLEWSADGTRLYSIGDATFGVYCADGSCGGSFDDALAPLFGVLDSNVVKIWPAAP